MFFIEKYDMLTFLLMIFGKIDQSQLIQDGHVFRHQTRQDIVASAKNSQDAAEYMNTLEGVKKWTVLSNQFANLQKINSQLTDYQAIDYKNQNGKIVVTYKQKDSQSSSVVQAYLHGVSELTKITDKALKYFYDLVTLPNTPQHRSFGEFPTVGHETRRHFDQPNTQPHPQMSQETDEPIYPHVNKAYNDYYDPIFTPQLDIDISSFTDLSAQLKQKVIEELLEKLGDKTGIKKFFMADQPKFGNGPSLFTLDQFGKFLNTLLTNNNDLVDLNLSKILIDDKKADVLIQQFPRMSKLTDLQINVEQISQEKMKALIQGIGQHCAYLTNLNLRDEYTYGLSSMLSHILLASGSRSIQEVIELKNEEFELILTALENCKGGVQNPEVGMSLKIRNAEVTDDNWIRFSKAFKRFSDHSEINIDLADNDISESLCDKMRENFGPKKSENIHLPLHGQAKQDLINRIFDTNFFENKLRFSYSVGSYGKGKELYFDDETWRMIVDKIKAELNAQTNKLEIARCNISSEQLEKLMNALPETLKELVLFDMKIDDQKARIIKNTVKSKLTNLETLRLHGNNLTHQYKEKLREDFEQSNPKLSTIQL